jgi:16S rRNA (adenine1518-N6/adenine1519-N6)-dimethyltransferase
MSVAAARDGSPPLWPGGLAELREELRRRGLRLTKRFGQNFMVDPNLARAVARAAGAGEGDVVLEVGPGTGHLTAALFEAGARVVAVEIDAGLCRMLRERLGDEAGLCLVEGSVLAKGDALSGEVVGALRETMRAAGGETFRVAANLPFNIAATFLIALASSDLAWSGGAVTLQREVAQRLAAPPVTKEYGASSVLWQLVAQGHVDRTIPREVFWPRPEVASALFTVKPRRDRDGAAGGREFAEFVKALFSSRRKVLRSGLAKAVPSRTRPEIDAALAAAGIDPGTRAEDVAPEGLLGLWERLGARDG